MPTELPIARPALVLEATAYTRGQLIAPEAPQTAFAGRSNVGKSSLINALAGRKKLAKVSAVPGKTRSINYYRLEGTSAYLVDLPGYGYAQCSKEERNAWAKLIEHYLQHTPGLCALVLLLDSRLPPQKADRETAALAVDLQLPLIPVLTKTDKCNRKELQQCVKAWSAFVRADSILHTSSQKRFGLEALWQELAARLMSPIVA